VRGTIICVFFSTSVTKQKDRISSWGANIQSTGEHSHSVWNSGCRHWVYLRLPLEYHCCVYISLPLDCHYYV